MVDFAVAEDADVRIACFNSAGEWIADLWNGRAAAYVAYTIAWPGTNYAGAGVTSNVYVLRLFAPKILLLKRITVIR